MTATANITISQEKHGAALCSAVYLGKIVAHMQILRAKLENLLPQKLVKHQFSIKFFGGNLFFGS